VSPTAAGPSEHCPVGFAPAGKRAGTQRVVPVAASPRTHGLGHLAVVRARTGWRHLRPLSGVLL